MLVPILVYERGIFFASTPLAKFKKHYFFVCTECHEVSLKTTKEDLVKRQVSAQDLEEMGKDKRFLYYFTLGHGYHRISGGEPLLTKEAERLLRFAIEEDPENPMPYNSLSVLYINAGQPGMALKWAGKAKERARSKNERALFLSNLATAYGERKQYKKAVECLEEAIEEDPVAGYHYELGSFYMEVWEYRKAISAFEYFLLYREAGDKMIFSEGDTGAAIAICKSRVGEA